MLSGGSVKGRMTVFVTITVFSFVFSMTQEMRGGGVGKKDKKLHDVI